MTLDDALGWASLVLIVMTMAVSLWALASHPHGSRTRCPGTCRGLAGWMDPRRMLIRGTCWYDLTGLAIGEEGGLRCPECGTKSSPKQLRTDGRRVRLELIALGLFFAAVTSFAGPWVRGGCWTRSIPTLALAALEHTNQLGANANLRCEVTDRVSGGEVTGLSASLLATALVQDLRDDDTHWNADRAMELLDQLGVEADEPLMRVLKAGDDQARVLAARLLRSRQFPPAEELLWACVEDLRDDAGLVNWYLSLNNAAAAAEFLVPFATESRDLLRTAMTTGDRQQRLLAAAVVGHARIVSLIDLAGPILVNHLGDNNVMGDAKVAAPALFRFGEAALAYLHPHIDSKDAQLRGIARSLIERIENPSRSIHRLKNSLPRITESVSDPLTELTIGESLSDLRWQRCGLG